MKLNPLLCTDFYKADHRTQYPDGTGFELVDGMKSKDEAAAFDVMEEVFRDGELLSDVSFDDIKRNMAL